MSFGARSIIGHSEPRPRTLLFTLRRISCANWRKSSGFRAQQGTFGPNLANFFTNLFNCQTDWNTGWLLTLSCSHGAIGNARRSPSGCVHQDTIHPFGDRRFDRLWNTSNQRNLQWLTARYCHTKGVVAVEAMDTEKDGHLLFSKR